ncbi:MAG: GDSL-type esterase/lipase family protein [Anditalea sp.]
MNINTPKNFVDQEKSFRRLNYLALGDSYTIGEGVDEADSFPHQLVSKLNDYSLAFFPPTVIAKTGWTAKELQKGIEQALVPLRKYDLVTLMIGVNNQYRGESLGVFEVEFSQLLDKAIALADNDPSRTISISIPDWGVTSFALEGDRNVKKIAKEIDLYNQVIQNISLQKGVHYLEVTQAYRKGGGLAGSLVADKLHPSGFIYKNWAEKLSQLILSQMDFK